jgi:hypothetical protein
MLLNFDLFVLVIAVIAIVTAIFLTSEWKRRREEYPPSLNPQNNRDQNISKSANPEFAALIEAIREEGRAYRKEEYREDDRKTVVDFLNTLFLILTFFVLAYTCYAIIQQVHEMQRAYGPISDQAKNSADQIAAMNGQQSVMHGQLDEMKADRRPWVMLNGAIVIDKPLVFNAQGAHIAFSGTLKNGGKSIAANIKVVASTLRVEPIVQELAPMSPEQFNQTTMRALPPGEESCGPDLGRKITAFGGLLLLPGAEQSWTPGTGGQIDVPISDFRPDAAGYIGVWMDICIFYLDDSKDVHGTPAVVKFVSDNYGERFFPVGEIHGRFQVSSSGAAVY